MRQKVIVIIVLIFGIINFYGQSSITKKTKMSNKLETATLANGCFWCTEAIFQRLKGVESVTSGYSGGTIKNPAYREITTGRTGHAEVIQLKFNPSIITFQEILDVFFSTHNPTTLNQQGYDKGTQYRSAIFYLDENQKQIALKSKQEFQKKLDREKYELYTNAWER